MGWLDACEVMSSFLVWSDTINEITKRLRGLGSALHSAFELGQGDKTSALHIDLNCLTHEAQPSRHGQAPRPAISRQRLPKAMKAGDNECGAKVPKAPLVSH